MTSNTANPPVADHHTTPRFVRGSVVPHLDTSTPAINAGAPVEIDGTPTSPENRQQQRMTTASLARNRAGDDDRPVRSGSSPDHLARETEVLEEFGLSGREGEENRAALLQSRKSDPAVLVDIPQGPSVEDFAAAGLLSPDTDERKVDAAT
ncbi:hypothetical protein BFW01_g4497 [Lasiodiplodia theobromae]|uniref:Uncharacterized protein n=1 Tax=Lasiodiplodia theobromae TaxID=45133 RepID=A0A5N5DJ91_9PEZI|nr:uncharacterized protein LTHEOB_11622 [Lasiodiplodia theobromae]KAB2577797.1 hypothetical protein DBV05_g3538 [Lasiodiplodia theobromae]KAF4537073.1 hypothetical protein LTHEOB_11622 [Lasiodiplodia theobromae]KAF9633603.1 hypothetical protein BFW01_g4497 [Lasiodiplodia theobromae]